MLQSIKEALKADPKLYRKYQQNYQLQIDKLISHPEVKALIDQLSLTEDQIQSSTAEIRHWLQEQEHCKHCQGLSLCPNMFKGHFSTPIQKETKLSFEWKSCSLHEQHLREERQKKLLKSHMIPKEVLEGSFKQLDKDEGNSEAIRAALLFCRQFPHVDRGLYLYGEFGVGKTHLMGVIASQIVEKGYSVYFIHVPTFFREIKQSLADQSFMDKIRDLEQIDCLILDDIGAENFSPWLRDEVLGPLVQYRLQNGKPILYTSNLDYDGLRIHLAESSQNQIEEMKAYRIAERIRSFTDAYRINGPNRRRAN